MTWLASALPAAVLPSKSAVGELPWIRWKRLVKFFTERSGRWWLIQWISIFNPFASWYWPNACLNGMNVISEIFATLECLEVAIPPAPVLAPCKMTKTVWARYVAIVAACQRQKRQKLSQSCIQKGSLSLWQWNSYMYQLNRFEARKHPESDIVSGQLMAT